MSELIQQILSLPAQTQLAIVQAIVANLQAQSPNFDPTEVDPVQLARLEQIAAAVEKGEKKAYTRKEMEEEFANRIAGS